MDSREEKVIDWKGDELKKMENLRTLIIKNAKFSKGPEHLPNSLRVLEWRGYPSCDTPFDFCAKKLTICKLQESELTLFGFRGSLNLKVCAMISFPLLLYQYITLTLYITLFFPQMFLYLRELNFNNCQYLTKILDISNLKNLEKISFHYCKELLTVHNSIGFLNKLKILDATGCQKLKSFPPMKLISLEELNLACCKSLENFPEILGEMKNITHIYLADTAIKELPVSFENLTGLTNLHLSGNGMLKLPSSILMIHNLSEIVASGCVLLPNQSHKLISTVSSNVDILLLPRCNISDEHLPIILTQFANMKALDLSGNNLTIVPESIKECRFLTRLYLVDCKCLREIRGLPPNLNYLSSLGCESLTTWCRNMLLNQVLFLIA
jgi:Leucine-rich repeat (LRR) protein